EERRLATLPVRLLPGAAAAASPPAFSPTRLSLLGLWTCALLAVVAAAVLLRGVMALSERRRVFVSAVTHELRTPLTTFRLYTDMLAQGMVTTEEKRRQYDERLDSGRGGGVRESFDLGALVESATERLRERVAGAGLGLAFEKPAEPIT